MSVLRNMLRLGYFHCLFGAILSSSLDQIIDVSCYNRYNNGTSYRGNVKTTENGTRCIKWKNSNSIYSHFTEDHNFCRNPLSLSKEIERPWCFTDAHLKYGRCKIPVCDVSCYNRYNNGTSYRGNVNTTENGTRCIKWKNSNPIYSHFTEDHNFCRNPLPLSKEIERPWCYTDAHLKYGRCKIPVCVLDCRNTISDLNYNGTIHTTRNGNTCRLWSIGSLYQNETANYCRTPFHDGDNAGGPWCYIDDGSWERCNIPVCGGSFCPDLSNYHLLTMDKKSKYQYGEIAIVVSCQKGDRHIEKTYLECTSTGVWNDTVPTCEEITCQPFILDNSVHASIQPDLNKYNVSTRITLSCIPGYIGPDTFTVCRADGQWSSQQTPNCTPSDCKTLIVGVNVKPSKQLHKFNDEVTLSCEIGYIGDPISIKCYSNGSWPIHRLNCKPANCDDLNVGAYVKPSKQQHKYNDNVTLSCEEGYFGVPISIKCYANGSWPTDRPNCKPITCSMLTVNDRIMKSDNISKFNDNVTLSCKQGYIRSSVILKCNATGFWPSQRPNCIAVTCRALRPLPHQKLEPDQMVSSYRDNITFKCDDGYELTTEYTMVTCQSDGTWSNKQPNCTEKSLSYKDSLKKRGKCISYGLFGGILAAIVCISAGGHIATCFYYRKQAGKSAAVYEDMKFNTVERQIPSNEDTYSELT